MIDLRTVDSVIGLLASWVVHRPLWQSVTDVVCLKVSVCMCMCVCVCVCVCVVCVVVCVCMCVRACARVCMCVCVYLHTCMYTHTRCAIGLCIWLLTDEVFVS